MYPGPSQEADRRSTGKAKSSTASFMWCAVAVRGACCLMTCLRGRPVYHYFREWRLDGTWDLINDLLRGDVRVAEGKQRQPNSWQAAAKISERASSHTDCV